MGDNCFSIDDVCRALEPIIERKVNAEFFIMEMYETCTDDDCVKKMEKFLTSIGMIEPQEDKQ